MKKAKTQNDELFAEHTCDASVPWFSQRNREQAQRLSICV